MKIMAVLVLVLCLFVNVDAVNSDGWPKYNPWQGFCSPRELYCVDCGHEDTLTIRGHALECSDCGSMSLKSDYVQQCQEIEYYKPIKVGDWVKTTKKWNMGCNKRFAGKVMYLKKGKPYAIATLRGGKRISTFWLEKMRTQKKGKR